MGNTLKPRLEHAEKTGVCSLSKCQIKEFPAAELQIPAAKLRSLDLSYNKLKLIPDAIGQLCNLKVLNLSHNKIIKLPDAICQLAKLEILNMAANHLGNLPPDFGKLSALKALNLSENKLKKFPLQVAKLPILDVLDLSTNAISEMADCEQLGSLNCSELLLNSNQLAVLPTNLAKCPRLKILRVQENCLTLDGIPSELLSSSGINALSLEGNLFEERELHQIQGWDAYQERYTASKKKMY
ncbi:leucine-rich repeat-containing protein 57-like [Varroa jacobsoni]|uniref:Leucine-rich repeat-containing protein 57 n=1 Tax=Varroa destructor TaxID=109461 RepID=A0A7M7L1X4_VARDE|nr:leucine-rich repeat-containing protein 57-like isoform X2 [Varroa destructor]XP_022687282.1 leucine-rich repeat-containing protein 57-like [Varroa jacobsoni]XP_022687283.1 leucine-rich repeat-containing protein 57-like [Varroa jacobsoni]